MVTKKEDLRITLNFLARVIRTLLLSTGTGKQMEEMVKVKGRVG